MRSFFFGSLSVMGLLLVVGCGDSSSDAGGSGGSGGSGGNGGEGAGTVNDGGAGAGVNDGGSGAGTTDGGGPPGECAQIAGVDAIDPADEVTFFGTVTPSIGGADPDELDFAVTPDATGTVTVTQVTSLLECGDTANCVYVIEDATEDGFARVYLASSGTIELGTTTPPFYVAGAVVSGVQLVEVNVDLETLDVSPVAGGACAETTADITFDIQPPVAGWECNPGYYDATDGCDCDCGAVDPDCEDPKAMVFGCENKTDTCVEGVCTPAPG